MNKLICDICGGAIVVQAGGKYGICDSCGANYTLDRMREIASGIKVSQTGSKEDVEQWKALLNTYLTAFDWEAAESTVKKILEAVPTDEYSLDVYKKLQSWKDYVIKEGTMLEYKGISNAIDIPYGVKCLDFYAINLAYVKGKITITIPETVIKIKDFAFSHRYLDLQEIFIPNSVQEIDERVFYVSDPYRNYWPKIYLPERFMDCKFIMKEGFDTGPLDFYNKDDFIFYSGEQTLEGVREIEIKNKKEQSANRRALGVCQHCGGVFKGFFNPRCTSCGKEKDY